MSQGVIYLNTVGGLCNRIRAMDSMLTLCQKFNRKLIVIWEKNKELNCAFEDIFEFPKIENLDLEIINTKPFQIVPMKGVMRLPKMGYFFLPTMKVEKISQSTLASLYASKKQTATRKTIHEMDNIFFDHVKLITDKIFKQDIGKSVFITSCYPLHPNTDSYSHFKPIPSILKKIDEQTKGFSKNTIGLHIRRTDHKVSREISSDDKFFRIIDHEMQLHDKNEFFICTDDKLVKETLKSRYRDKIITNDLSSYSRNEKSAIEDAVLDLFCLSRTCKVYGSFGSTFSQVAADIGGVEEISLT